MTQTVEVADIEKTHKNAIAELVQTACKFESHIEIESEGKNINAKSLMGIMAFGLKKGMEVSISAKGTDEKAAVDCISQFLTSNAASIAKSASALEIGIALASGTPPVFTETKPPAWIILS